jgi:hypothetical protein
MKSVIYGLMNAEDICNGNQYLVSLVSREIKHTPGARIHVDHVPLSVPSRSCECFMLHSSASTIHGQESAFWGANFVTC